MLFIGRGTHLTITTTMSWRDMKIVRALTLLVCVHAGLLCGLPVCWKKKKDNQWRSLTKIKVFLHLLPIFHLCLEFGFFKRAPCVLTSFFFGQAGIKGQRLSVSKLSSSKSDERQRQLNKQVIKYLCEKKTHRKLGASTHTQPDSRLDGSEVLWTTETTDLSIVTSAGIQPD